MTEDIKTNLIDDGDDEGFCATCIHGVSTSHADQYFYFCKKYETLTHAFGSLPDCSGKDWERVK